MIIFETIRWKNFLSTGNTGIEVKLNDEIEQLLSEDDDCESCKL